MTTPMIVPGAQHEGVWAKATQWKWIYWAASASALAAVAIFLVGIFVPAAAENWLITIFRLHAGSNGAVLSQLYELNALDLVLLALVATTYVGLYFALHRRHPILAAIAAVQPPLGILLFLLTQNAGRSGVMGACLVISLAMLRGGPFGKWTGWTGMLCSALLLAGDLGTDLEPSIPLAVATGLGYVLLIVWLVAVGRQLFQLAR